MPGLALPPPFTAAHPHLEKLLRRPLPARSYFETEDWKGIPGQWWFGGGTDITPNYIVEEDMRHFHGVYKVRGAGRGREGRASTPPVRSPLLVPCPRPLPPIMPCLTPAPPPTHAPAATGRVRPPRPHLV